MPNWKKVVTSGSAAQLNAITMSGNIIPDSDNVHSLGDSTYRFLLNGGTPVTVTGSGTSNTITRFQGATTVEDSKLFSSDTQTRLEHNNSGNQIFIVSGSTGQMLSVSDEVGENILRVNNDSGTEIFSVSASGALVAPNLPYETSGYVLSYSSGSGEVKFVSASAVVNTNITEDVTVSQTFTNATTASVNHLFGTKDVVVTVYDDNDDQFIPSRVNTPDINNVNIYMDPATTGRVVVAKGGHLVSGSIHKHLMTSVTSSTITHNLQEEFPIVQIYESASKEMFIPETIKSIDQNNTQVVLEEIIDCYVVIKR